ncbi:MAG: hypothetical protein H8E86_02075 [Planctomycetes bacterium]|nr:hypothetical protein [Planctomycetota bacterium]
MVLLLLGLALVLATSSSLLASSGSWGEDEDRDDSRSTSNPTLKGEVAGSVTVTRAGEIWLTILVDELTLHAQLEVIRHEGAKGFRLSIHSIASPAGEFGAVSPQLKPFMAQEMRVIEFYSEEQATQSVISMLSEVGIVLSDETMASIPYAISSGWRSPSDCEQFVRELLQEHKNKEQ